MNEFQGQPASLTLSSRRKHPSVGRGGNASDLPTRPQRTGEDVCDKETLKEKEGGRREKKTVSKLLKFTKNCENSQQDV